MSMQTLIAGGHLVDAILVFMAVEFAILYVRRRRHHRRGAAIDPLFALAPGAILLLALRASLTGAGWVWIAALLAASLPIHLIDLARRRL